MTLWEFQACVDGWVAANRTKEAAPPAMDDETLGELGIEGF
jgi:hypothetical protein